MSRFIVKARVLIVMGFAIALFIDAVMEKKSDLPLLLIIILWLLVVKGFQLKSSATFKLTLGFLAFLFVLFIFARTHPLTELVSTWIYLFLALGVVQQFREFRG